MGQKTHPKLFRLASHEKQYSSWVSKSKARLLQSDYLTRTLLQTDIDVHLGLPIAHITLERHGHLKAVAEVDVYLQMSSLTEWKHRVEQMLLHAQAFCSRHPRSEPQKSAFHYYQRSAGFPIFENGQASLDISFFFKIALRFFLRNVSQKLFILGGLVSLFSLRFCRNPLQNAPLVARMLLHFLSEGVAFKRIFQTFAQRLSLQRVTGFKLTCSGRLGGADMATTESKVLGAIPLQKLKARISYARETLLTEYGIFGVKIWIRST